jgi:hypothetical protein
MKKSASEAKLIWLETFHIKDQVKYLTMDSKADDIDLFREFKMQRKINLITCCCEKMEKSQQRTNVIKFIKRKKHKKNLP